MADDSHGENPQTRHKSREPSRRTPRLRLACLRCQRRKIRCDGDIPVCKNCWNSGADCVDGESARLRDLPRALKRRVSWLESIIRTRCPDVDLSQGPPCEDPDAALEDQALDEPAQINPDSLIGSPVRDVPAATIEPPVEAQSLEPLASGPSAAAANTQSHEIGLVSLGTNQEPRYIGPSSGYFLARVMLNASSRQDERTTVLNRDAPFPTQLVEASQGPLALPSRELARQLADAYFDAVHVQYPVLHQPTFLRMMDQIYDSASEDPAANFQTFMVLGIGALVLSSRLKARIPGESYFLSALPYFTDLNLENSLQGVQCLLLVLIFTIHSPCVRLNAWYLNYHCLAALLDLGLQRDVDARSGVSVFEQEMRTRIFWVIFTLDRTIATMMGRPIGVREEACELRMPQGLSDDMLAFSATAQTPVALGRLNQMEFAMHLFRAAKLNSEIKYVANSITRDAPKYAYPPIVNIHEWQSDMLCRIEQWAKEIPSGQDGTPKYYHRATCLLRYHGLRMLLLRPSPAIPKPSFEALTRCYDSARDSVRLFDILYRKNLLIQNWIKFHSLVLSTITMLYCIKIVPNVARKIEADVLMGDMSISLRILSAIGEHWSGAKRSRDILDELGRSVIRWLRDVNLGRGFMSTSHAEDSRLQHEAQMDTAGVPISSIPNPSPFGSYNLATSAESIQNPFNDLLINGCLAQYSDGTETDNIDHIVRNLFQDFIPSYPTFP